MGTSLIPAVGSESSPSSSVQDRENLVRAVEEVKTGDGEQLQARHVEESPEEGGAVQSESDRNRESRARLEALLRTRSTHVRADEADERSTQRAEKADKARAEAAFQRSQAAADTSSPVRDSGADPTVTLDVAA